MLHARTCENKTRDSFIRASVASRLWLENRKSLYVPETAVQKVRNEHKLDPISRLSRFRASHQK